METLLRKDFTSYYGLPECIEPDITQNTTEEYFELEDTELKEIVIHTVRGNGMANFANPQKLDLVIANYDKFVSSLPHQFQHAQKRCDIGISGDNSQYFVLGELKDSPNIKKHRSKAKKQLLMSLNSILAVPTFSAYINLKTIKRCCYFNKQSKAPSSINASTAFNRLPNAFPDGFEMPNPEFESLGFSFYEYTGRQTLVITS